MVVSEAIINEIIKKGENPDPKVQLEGAYLMCNEIFPGGECIDGDIIPRLLPTIMKYMTSKDPTVQEEGVFFTTAVTTTSNGIRTAQENTKLAIDHGAIPRISNLLSSENPGVLEITLRCLGNIAADFPEDIVYMNAVEPNIIKHVGSKERKVCEEALKCLTTIVSTDAQLCHHILDLGILNSFKKLLTRAAEIRLLSLRFLKKVTDYDEEEIGFVIQESLVPMVVKQIHGAANSHGIKIKSFKTLKNIISKKPEQIPIIIECGIISSICASLQSNNDKLVLIALSLFENMISVVGYEDVSQKFVNSGGPRHLQNLFEHSNDEIKEVANRVYFISDNEDVKQQPTAFRGRRNVKPDPSAETNVEDEPIPSTSNARDQRRTKRALNAAIRPEPSARSKRFRISLEQTDTDQTSTSDYAEHLNDLDDIQAMPSPRMNSMPIILPTMDFAAPLAATATPPAQTSDDNRNRHEDNVFVPEATASPTLTSEVETARNHSAAFPPVEYFSPPEYYLSKCCKKLGIEFIRTEYAKTDLCKIIQLTQISSTSKPSKLLPAKDKSGFSCLSVFLTGTEKHTDAIKQKINEHFIDIVDGSDKEKLKKVLSPWLLDDHFEIITQLFECRFMVYCNEAWMKFGNWDAEKEDIPLFVISKTETDDGISYEIVLALKD